MLAIASCANTLEMTCIISLLHWQVASVSGGAFKMVRNTVDYAGYGEGCTIRTYVGSMDRKK